MRDLMNFKQILFFLGILSVLQLSLAHGQTLKVENVKFAEKDSKIYVTYDFSGNPKKKYNISLALSYDFGTTYTMKPITLSGDVGKGVVPGMEKKIEWDMFKDYPDGLQGEGFIFAVRVNKDQIKKWLPYALSGTGVAGGLVWYYMKSQAKDKKNTSILTITIPADL